MLQRYLRDQISHNLIFTFHIMLQFFRKIKKVLIITANKTFLFFMTKL